MSIRNGLVVGYRSNPRKLSSNSPTNSTCKESTSNQKSEQRGTRPRPTHDSACVLGAGETERFAAQERDRFSFCLLHRARGLLVLWVAELDVPELVEERFVR